jgi:hypothetical protein
MSFLLPDELWLQIASHLPKSCLSNLIRSNRTMYSILLHFLYQDLYLWGYKYSDHTTSKILTQISTNPNLSQAIRSCTLSGVGSITFDAAFLSFRSFPNLSNVTLDQTSIDEAQLDQLLISINKRPFSFTLSKGNIKTRRPHQPAKSLVYHLNGPLPRFTSLSIAYTSSIHELLLLFIYWTSTPTLEYLSLRASSRFIISFLSGRFTGLSAVPFPKLKELYLSCFWDADIRLFELMPLLEKLYFFVTCESQYTNTLNLPIQLLPRLHDYYGPAQYVWSIVPGRPICDLTLIRHERWLPGSILGIPKLNFGSLTPIRCLTFKGASDPLEVLKFAVSACPALHVLIIVHPYDMMTTPVCNSPNCQAKPTTSTDTSIFF